MDYEKDILSRLINIYERREAFKKDASSIRAIQIDVKKEYPSYSDRYDHDEYKEINAAIEKLLSENLVTAGADSSGRYAKIRLNPEKTERCYEKLKRVSIPDRCEAIKSILYNYANSESKLITGIVNDWLDLTSRFKKLPYDIKYDGKRAGEVLMLIQAIEKLNKETYIRNFSTAMLMDSKKFQREYKSCIESILFDYTEEVVEKEKILEFYNLYENPTYVLIKGDAAIHFEKSVVYVGEMPRGIAFSNTSLEKIRQITVNSDKVITVENLTTYHDAEETDGVHIYLGGFHNRSKQAFLEKIYEDNRCCEYFHKGDIDVFGFLILENLKEKTGIPFKPLMMDKHVLEKFYEAGIFKELTAADVRIIEARIDNKLKEYEDVLRFMLDKNCKVEQESMKAVELLV